MKKPFSYTTTKHATTWLAMQILWLVSLFYGTIHGNTYAWSLFCFLIWMHFLVEIVLGVSLNRMIKLVEGDKKQEESIRKLTYYVLPQSIDSIYDMTVAFYLAAFGHYLFAVMVIVALGCQIHRHDISWNAVQKWETREAENVS
jgi:hypothetical protein